MNNLKWMKKSFCGLILLLVLGFVPLMSKAEKMVALDSNDYINEDLVGLNSYWTRESLYTYENKSANRSTSLSGSGPITQEVSLKNLFSNYLSGLTTGGYFRGFFWSRSMKDPYDGLGANDVLFNTFDQYYNPTLFIYVGGNPTPNTSFGTEIIVFDPFAGSVQGDGTFNVFNTMVMRGSASTKYGNFGLIAGGIEWRTLTAFTLGSNIAYNRFSVFNRQPWDGVGNLKDRYAGYYYTGTYNIDQRWGTQGFKGFMLNGWGLPWDLSFDLFYGISQFNQGITREAETHPSHNVGTKIVKKFSDNVTIGLNTFHSVEKPDSIIANKQTAAQFNLFTSEYDINIKGIKIFGEIGFGGYQSPTYERDWGGAIITDVTLPKRMIKFAEARFRYYEIGASFVNNVANFQNTTIREVNTGVVNANTVVLTPFASSVGTVGFLANNRRSGSVNLKFDIARKLKIALGVEASGELKDMGSRQLSYNHVINSVTWSRFVQFPFNGSFGPNNRVGTFFRGAYETVNLTDTTVTGNLANGKFFNAVDLQLKYKQRLFGKDLYVFFLSQLTSAQGSFSPIPKFNDDAYIRASYNQLDIYYELFRTLYIDFYLGYENVLGNKFTDLSIDGLPRNQVGRAVGVGLDFSLSKNAHIFLRHRWFDFEDKNFLDENFKGWESTIEMKMFF